jgi:hypothetical protein
MPLTITPHVVPVLCTHRSTWSRPSTAQTLLRCTVCGRVSASCTPRPCVNVRMCNSTIDLRHGASGPKYGPEFAANTPGYLGCSGAVAAITAYKMFQQPLAMQMLVVLPLPVVLLQLLYICLEVKEKVCHLVQQLPPGSTAGTSGAIGGGVRLRWLNFASFGQSSLRPFCSHQKRENEHT